MTKMRVAAPKQLIRHEHTYLSLEATQEDKRLICPFQKTISYDGVFIDQAHHRLALSPLHDNGQMINLGIEGWLLLADALKLYEMAYFCGGDILELGTFKGLSTSIMAEASSNNGREFSIVTVDLDPAVSEAAKSGMEVRCSPGRANVHFFVFDAGQFVRNLAEADRRFEFVFVDHSHAYEHVRDTCVSLHRVLKPGCFVLFHDYNDPRNADTSNQDYGVYQGVNDGLSSREFEFWGIYGCTGLFRRKGS